MSKKIMNSRKRRNIQFQEYFDFLTNFLKEWGFEFVGIFFYIFFYWNAATSEWSYINLIKFCSWDGYMPSSTSYINFFSLTNYKQFYTTPTNYDALERKYFTSIHINLLKIWSWDSFHNRILFKFYEHINNTLSISRHLS